MNFASVISIGSRQTEHRMPPYRQCFHFSGYCKTGVQISLENSNLNISLEYNHFSKFKLSGCKACDEYEKYKKISGKIRSAQYFKNNPTSLITSRIIFDDLRNDGNISKAKSLFLKLPKKQQVSYYGKQIELRIQANNLVGSQAINFAKKDINGNEVVLYDLIKKNYVLLEFWGSWCNPCRGEHPELIDLYQKYQQKGFKIIGIADDDNSVDKWKKAVKDDNVEIWPQILRGKKLMRIRIPRTRLILAICISSDSFQHLY